MSGTISLDGMNSVFFSFNKYQKNDHFWLLASARKIIAFPETQPQPHGSYRRMPMPLDFGVHCCNLSTHMPRAVSRKCMRHV